MPNDKLVSIIVPLYNAEQYLEKCISSILNQTYQNIELILVNDGSTDRSGEICLKFVRKDNRVRYIEQINAGPSASRNIGIINSSGYYVQFLDSDDYLKKNAVEILVAAIKDVDYVIAGYYNNIRSSHQDTEKHVKSSLTGSYLKEDIMPYWGKLVEEEVFHYAWNKLYKSKIIKDNILYNENISISEDMLFNIDYMSNISRIKVIDDPICHHVLDNQESLTKRYHNGLFEMRKLTHIYMETFLKRNNIYFDNNSRVVEELFAKKIISIFIHLCSPETEIVNIEKLKIVNKIVEDDSVRSVLKSFQPSPLSKITAKLIRNKMSISIILVYYMINPE